MEDQIKYLTDHILETILRDIKMLGIDNPIVIAESLQRAQAGSRTFIKAKAPQGPCCAHIFEPDKQDASRLWSCRKCGEQL